MDSVAPIRGLRIQQWLFYFLIAFQAITLAVSLYVNRRIGQIYVESVRQNRTWSTIERQAARLSNLAAEIDRPGNEVFETQDLAAAEVALRRALNDYREQSKTVKVSIQRRHPTERMDFIVAQVREADELVGAMESATLAILDHLKEGGTGDAAERMAELDRTYARVNGLMFDIIETIGGIEQEHFESQIAAAAWFQTVEYALAAAVLAMIGGALAYAIYATRQFDSQMRERQMASQALREAHDQLEMRVAERTRELQQANESLQFEIAERRRAEHALRRAAAVRLRLVDRLLVAQERERLRLAHDLHDGVSQMLTSLSFGLQSLAIHLEKSDPARSTRAQDLHGIAAATLAETRRLARGLRPVVLEDLGLVVALERLVAEFDDAEGIQVHWTCDLEPGARLPAQIETSIYRLVQESLTNAWRHANARHVWVRLAIEPGRVSVSVEDDGRGFLAPSATVELDGHIGLASMRERIERLRGEFTIISTPGRGTTIGAFVPLEHSCNA